MIKECFGLLLFFLALGAFFSIFIFSIDVIRWHDKESRVKIKPSNDLEQIVPDISTESEVKEDERDVTEFGECDTSPFYGTWCEP